MLCCSAATMTPSRIAAKPTHYHTHVTDAHGATILLPMKCNTQGCVEPVSRPMSEGTWLKGAPGQRLPWLTVILPVDAAQLRKIDFH